MPEAKVGGAIMYSFDDRNMLWLQIFDTRGFLVCIAPVPLEGAAKLADYIDDRLGEVEEDADEMGEVAGHA